MIQDRPVCFDCEERVTNLTDAVFAPPYLDDPTAPSAIFHPICLMRWRERRDALRERIYDALRRHAARECSCFEDAPDDA